MYQIDTKQKKDPPMTSTTALTLTFEDTTITAFNTATDNPTFLASPIAKKLNYASAKDMLRNLEDDEKGRHIVPTLGGPQEMAVITLPGLMHALNNRRPGAIKDPEMRAMVTRFQRWVNHEVLPAILRTGRYVPEQPTSPSEDGRDDVIQALVAANRELTESNAALRGALQEVTRLLTSGNSDRKPRRHTAPGEDHTPAERWYLQQIKEHGYAVPKDCPFDDPMAEHKRMIAKFGLISKTKRIPREGYDHKKVERVLLPSPLTPAL